jgi:teichuronic acid exporter
MGDISLAPRPGMVGRLRAALARIAPRSAYWVDVAWVAGINALAQGIGVLAMPLLTRLYTPADFAAVNVFVNTAAFASVLLSLRLEYMVQLAREDGEAVSLVHLVWALSLAGCAVAMPLAWVFRAPLAQWLGSPGLAGSLVFVPVTAALVSASLALQHLRQRQQQFKVSSSSDVVNKLGYVGTALAGHLLMPGPGGLLAAQGAGACGKLGWLLQAGHGLSVSVRTFDTSTMARMFSRYMHLSGSLVVSHLMLALTGLIPSVFIGHVYGAAVLGQFALVMSTIFLPASLLGMAIGQVYYQRSAAAWAEGRDFHGYWRDTTRKLFRLGAPIYALVALASPWAYPLVFGSNWELAGQFAPYMAVTGFFAFLTGPLDRSCLIVGAWRYIPLWHMARTLTTAAVAALAWWGGWSAQVFLLALTLQMSTLYMVDFFAERRFSRLRPGS